VERRPVDAARAENRLVAHRWQRGDWSVGDIAVGTAKVVWLGASGFLIGAIAALLFMRPHTTRDESPPSVLMRGRHISTATPDDVYLGPGPGRLQVRARRSSAVVPALVVASIT